MSAVVVERDVVTPWGRGLDACWRGVMTGRPAFSSVERFDTSSMQTHLAATVAGLDPAAPESLVMQMLRPLLGPLAGRVPADTLVLLATTTGEVDLLERHLLNRMTRAPDTSDGRRNTPHLDPLPQGERTKDDARARADDVACIRLPLPSGERDGVRVWAGEPPVQIDESRLDRLLGRITALLGVDSPGRVVSAACVSSAAAVAQGAALIAAGERDSVLVVGCDAVTEFVYAGFSSLLALDPGGARPFDSARKGLTIGEAAAYALLMSPERAEREGRRRLGRVDGWGLSSDANHMTGPSRDGDGLARAIRRALAKAGMGPAAVGSVSAHGTGTVYNDSMEMKAFRQVFGETPVPVYSIKGSVGHTMGAAGLLEMLVALQSLQEGVVPPSANLGDVDPEARGWVSPTAVKAGGMRVALSTNSGFGGVNAALVLSPGEG
jgi:3-oxoacyl-[acyl-carrier-protein] synthase II